MVKCKISHVCSQTDRHPEVRQSGALHHQTLMRSGEGEGEGEALRLRSHSLTGGGSFCGQPFPSHRNKAFNPPCDGG